MSKKKKTDHLVNDLMNQIIAAGLPRPCTEVRFAMERIGSAPGIRSRLKKYGLKDWRFDFLFREERLAIEVNGGNYVGGRHSNATALTDEYRKINKAQQLGFRVLIFDGKLIKSREAVRQIAFMLRSE